MAVLEKIYRNKFKVFFYGFLIYCVIWVFQFYNLIQQAKAYENTIINEWVGDDKEKASNLNDFERVCVEDRRKEVEKDFIKSIEEPYVSTYQCGRNNGFNEIVDIKESIDYSNLDIPIPLRWSKGMFGLNSNNATE